MQSGNNAYYRDLYNKARRIQKAMAQFTSEAPPAMCAPGPPAQSNVVVHIASLWPNTSNAPQNGSLSTRLTFADGATTDMDYSSACDLAMQLYALFYHVPGFDPLQQQFAPNVAQSYDSIKQSWQGSPTCSARRELLVQENTTEDQLSGRYRP